MESEWRTSTLRDAGINLIDCDHRTPVASASGYPYITIPQLKDGHINISDVRRITRQDYEDWTRKLKPREHDVIVVRRCSSGVSAVVPKGLECAIGQNLVVLRSDGHQVLPEFLRWLTRGEEWWEQVRKFLNVGAVFDSLKCKDIPNFEVIVPPIEDQRAIAQLLNALDDKITLLRGTNATLEAIAQAIFRSWFVDFDPVRAKAEGRDPEGVPPEVAELFPSEFEDSELGAIPKGWRALPFLGAIQVVGGGTPKTSVEDYWGGEIAWFSVVDTPGEGDVFVLSTQKSITQAGLHNSSTRLLRPGTTIISARGTVGKIAMVGREMAMNQSCYGLQGHIFGDAQTYFSTRRLVSVLKQRSHGSVFETITRETLGSVQVVVAPQTISSAFEGLVNTLLSKVKTNVEEIATLAETRDTLLPRLMSGKIRIEEIGTW